MGIVYSFCNNLRIPASIQKDIEKEREEDIRKIWDKLYEKLETRAENAKSGEDEYMYLPEYETITLQVNDGRKPYSKQFCNHRIVFPYHYELKVGDKKEFTIKGTVVYLEIFVDAGAVVYRFYR